VLWTPRSSRTLSAASPPRSAIVDDRGAWVIYETSAGSEADLRGFEVATGRDILLASRSVEFWVAPVFGSSISNDGATVLYVAPTQSGQPSQTWAIHPDGTGRRQLTDFPEGVTEAAVIGSGQGAIVATGGRLVSIELASGSVHALIANTPTCFPGTPGLAPGSLFALTGTALASSTQTASAPLPTELAGAQVLMNGTPLPLLSASPSLIWLQVPFEATPGTTVTLSVSYGSPFDGCRVPNQISGQSPYLLLDGTGTGIFVHQGFSGLVTPESPARAGEVVTAYALGLGAVTPPVPTGAATPLDQLYRLSEPFACYQGSADIDGPPLDVLFAGLAPGMIGVYQVNIHLPDPLPAGPILLLNCGAPGDSFARTGAFLPIAAPSVK
jgi:uncharacterized protein (TIGR03437 family)